MLNKYQIFKNVLDRCNTRIDIAAKYLIDNDFSANDYTFEYAVTELLYDNCIIKRAVTNEKNTKIEKIFSDTKNLVGHFGDKLWPRLFDLHKSYFSVEEFQRLYLQIEGSYDKNDSQDDHLMSLIIDLFERKDKVNVFSESEGIFSDHLKSFYRGEYKKMINSYKELSKSINKELSLIISKSDVISNYTAGIQSSIRQMNLIPNTQEYNWWYTIKHINSDNIEEALKQSLEKDNVSEDVKIMEMVTKMEEKASNWEKSKISKKKKTTYLSETFSNLGQNSNYFFSKELPDLPAQYMSYGTAKSSSEDEPLPSEHEIPGEVMYNNYYVNKQAIRQAIHVIETDGADKQLKKETVAILLLLVNEDKEAFEILNG